MDAARQWETLRLHVEDGIGAGYSGNQVSNDRMRG